MPTIPSLSQAFSALGSAMKVPAASAFGSPLPAPKSVGAFPAVPSLNNFLNSMKPAAPASPFAIPSGPQSTIPKPATPNMSVLPNQSKLPANTSTVNGPVYSPPPVIPQTQSTVPTVAPKAAAPAVPNVQSTPTQSAAPAYQPAAPVQMPSGNTFDANTGAPVNPETANIGNTGGSAAYSGSSGGAPALPQLGTGDSSNMSSNPLFNNPQDQAAYDAYQKSLLPSQEELDTQKQLNDLNTSAATAYTNTSGQAIPLPFITGQQAQLQREQSTLAQPLESQLSLLQAKRQMAQTASKSALDREDAKIAALRSMSAPVATTYGGTLSRFNPATGQYETVVNPFGTASNSQSGAPTTTDVIGQAIASGQLSADQVTRYGIPFIAATLQADPGYNFITQKASVGADSASLKTQQAYVDTTQRAFNTANDNLASLVSYMTQAKINSDSTVPLLNQLQNQVKAGALDPGAIAGYQSAIAGLRSEYAQVLSRGGDVTDASRASANALIPDNLTPAQLQQVADRLNTEGSNAIKEATASVAKIKTRVGSNSGGSSSSSSSSNSSSGANPFSAANFFGQ